MSTQAGVPDHKDADQHRRKEVWSTTRRSHFTCINDAKFCPINLIEMLSENLLGVAFQNGEIWVFDINNGKAISKIALGSNIVSVFGQYSSTNINLKGFESYFAERFFVFGTQSGKLMLGDVLTSEASTALELPSKITATIHNCKVVVCGTSEGDIGLYDPGKKLFKIVNSAHKGFIGTFCFFEENKTLYLLSSGSDNVLKLWRVGWYDLELTLQKDFLNKHRDAITCAMFHRTPSSKLLTGSYDNNVILWEDGSIKVFEGLQSSVLKIAYSGDYILGCGNDGALVMWHKNGAVLMTIPGIDRSSAVLTFHVAEVDSGKFDVTLAYVDLDGSIKINKPLENQSDLENDPDGLYAFKRKKNCSYHEPRLDGLGNWPWCKAEEGGSENKRFRFCLTSIPGPENRPKCIGFARRRIGRGGRIVFDRALTPLDDYHSAIDAIFSSTADCIPLQDELASEIRNEWKHFQPKSSISDDDNPVPSISASDEYNQLRRDSSKPSSENTILDFVMTDHSYSSLPTSCFNIESTSCKTPR